MTDSGAPWLIIILFWFVMVVGTLSLLAMMVAVYTGLGACAVLGECF